MGRWLMVNSLTRSVSLVLSFCLILEQSVFAQTIDLSHYFARNPALNIPQSDKFRPLHLRYISYDNQANDFKLLLDKGDFFNQKTEKPKNEKTLEIEKTTQELMKYFFIGLALPNEKFWVNLRPDSSDNILDPDLEKTDIGRIFLEADLQLKKDTSGMTSPQTKEGREYWDKLYKKAGELFGTENITIPTITRPWIVPNEIIIRESPEGAYIYKATLKVMLEEDYLTGRGGSRTAPTYQQSAFSDPRLKELNEYSTQLIKESIIPKLTYEVNASKRYAPLRQVYYSLILAQWFKQKYGSVRSARAPDTRAPVNSYIDLIDSRNLNNLISEEPYDKQSYFQQYQKSFKDGEYSLQEPVYTPTGHSIRRYVSGGIGQFNVQPHVVVASSGIEVGLAKEYLLLFDFRKGTLLSNSPLENVNSSDMKPSQNAPIEHITVPKRGNELTLYEKKHHIAIDRSIDCPTKYTSEDSGKNVLEIDLKELPIGSVVRFRVSFKNYTYTLEKINDNEFLVWINDGWGTGLAFFSYALKVSLRYLENLRKLGSALKALDVQDVRELLLSIGFVVVMPYFNHPDKKDGSVELRREGWIDHIQEIKIFDKNEMEKERRLNRLATSILRGEGKTFDYSKTGPIYIIISSNISNMGLQSRFGIYKKEDMPEHFKELGLSGAYFIIDSSGNVKSIDDNETLGIDSKGFAPAGTNCLRMLRNGNEFFIYKRVDHYSGKEAIVRYDSASSAVENDDMRFESARIEDFKGGIIREIKVAVDDNILHIMSELEELGIHIGFAGGIARKMVTGIKPSLSAADIDIVILGYDNNKVKSVNEIFARAEEMNRVKFRDIPLHILNIDKILDSEELFLYESEPYTKLNNLRDFSLNRLIVSKDDNGWIVTSTTEGDYAQDIAYKRLNLIPALSRDGVSRSLRLDSVFRCVRLMLEFPDFSVDGGSVEEISKAVNEMDAESIKTIKGIIFKFLNNPRRSLHNIPENFLDMFARAKNPDAIIPLLKEIGGDRQTLYSILKALPIEKIAEIVKENKPRNYNELLNYKDNMGVAAVANSPLLNENKNAHGGVDFAALPIVTEPTASGIVPFSRMSNVLGSGVLIDPARLDAEWAQIQAMVNAAIRPAPERLERYAASVSSSLDYPRARDKFVDLLADILRNDETSQRQPRLEPALRNILLALESE